MNTRRITRPEWRFPYARAAAMRTSRILHLFAFIAAIGFVLASVFDVVRQP